MIPMIQGLESRQLLSSTLDSGVLTVTGTAQKDNITVALSKDGTTITVTTRSGSRFKKGAAVTETYAATDVTSLVIDGGAGNDSISLKGSRKTPFSLAASITGGDGNDTIYGGAGNDTIDGGAGDDDLYGGAGADSITGDAGDDLLVGGKGIDTLDGGDGDDLIESKGDGSVDIIDGGADTGTAAGAEDNDLAIADSTETLTNAIAATRDNLFAGAIFGGGDFHGGGGGHGGGDCPPPGSDAGSTSGSTTGSTTGTATGTTTTTSLKALKKQKH